MHKVHEGKLDATGKKVAIVAGRYNDDVTGRLLASAVDCLVKHGVDPDDVDVYWVPGAFEVPQLAWKLAGTGGFDGIVCLGTIIRGETYHFEILASSVIDSIAGIARGCSVPATYGIISADTLEQALSRAGGSRGNKGWESALALIEMMSLWSG